MKARLADRSSKTQARRRRLGTVAGASITVLLLTGVAASGASGAKFIEASIGGASSGGTGGLFNAPVDIAANEQSVADGNAAASGDFYVAEASNHRISRYNANNTFDMAFGRDVVSGSTSGNADERQAVTVTATAGTFTLTFAAQTTAPIAFDATAAAVQTALEDLSNLAPGDVVVTGGPGDATGSSPYVIQFAGAQANVNLAQMTASAAGLGGGTATVATRVEGAISFEVCVAGVDVCKAGITTVAAPTIDGTLGGNGTFNSPQGVAVDQESGNVYVSDRGNRRISVYTADGAFLRSFGFDVQVGGTTVYEICGDDVADTGDICKTGVGLDAGPPGQYGVSTTSNHYKIDVSKPDGNPATGFVFLANTSSERVERFNLDGTAPANFGTALTDFAANNPLSVAVAPNGIVYASDTVGNLIRRYDPVAGSFLSPIDPAAVTGTASVATTGLEVDRQTGNLLVSRSSSAVGVLELGSPAGSPTFVDAYFTNAVLGVPGTAFPSTVSITGIGINPDGGKLFVSQSSGGHRVHVLDGDGIAPIVTSLEPATNVQATTADLHATINPSPTGPTGQSTSYRFEVSKDGVNWTQVTSNTQVPPNGDTNAATPVQAQATALEPNTSYRVRVVATRANGTGGTISAELVFITDPAVAQVTTDGASGVTDTSARLNGRVNPGGLATSYWFEWGDDDYGNTVPVPAGSAGSGSLVKAVGEALTGLTSDVVYHFRLCAQNSLSASPVCGADRTFTTRTPIGASPARAFEMVTSPDKVLRRGGANAYLNGAKDYARLEVTNFVNPEGDVLLWNVFAGISDPDAGSGFSHDRGFEFRERKDRDGDGKADGWYGDAVVKVPAATNVSAADTVMQGLSGDLKTQVWQQAASPFPTKNALSTFVQNDSGGPLGAGWYPTVQQSWTSSADPGVAATGQAPALVDNHGARWLGTSINESIGKQFRILIPEDDTQSPEQLGQTQNGALFMFGPPSWRPRDYVNECTGVALGDQTTLPTRNDAGTPADLTDDTLGERSCGVGDPTEVRGAVVGSGAINPGDRLAGTVTTAMSDDGSRAFFVSPDSAVTACASTTGAATQCPPQLFVRQYDDVGNATVRWLSRPENALFDAPQRIGALGSGVVFEGASSDGSVVYFRTDAPLTSDDPNGGVNPITGPAGANSWDLYRYELGDSNSDPAPAGDDPGDRLTRVTAGPDPDSNPADPNTSCPAVATSGPQIGSCATTLTAGGEPLTPSGRGSSARFVSNDGDRVYFVTVGRIPGADVSAPTGGSTTPTAANAQANTQERNLYLYDADKAGAAAYQFIARIPFGVGGTNLAACASSSPRADGTPRNRDFTTEGQTNCVHGTGSGDAIAFETPGQLTADDADAAGDVYLYDAEADELVRLSAPAPGASPYTCIANSNGSTAALCNGDLGPSPSQVLERVGLNGQRHMNMAEDESGALTAAYFESRQPLAAGAAANDAMKVYEWRDGKLTLISPAGSSDSAFYRFNSRDGQDVFFWTEQRISAWEIDDADGDVYSATTRPDRLPDPPPAPVVCLVLADACQDGGAPPTQVSPKTDQSGDGDVAPGERARITLAAVGAKARTRAVRNGVLALRARTTVAGRLTAVARARVGSGASRKGLRRVADDQARANANTPVSLRLPLTKAARNDLRAGRALRLNVQVAQSGARTRTITVLLRRAGS
jgi:NHL repeat-containing protein